MSSDEASAAGPFDPFDPSTAAEAVVACRPVDWTDVGVSAEQAAALEDRVAQANGLPADVRPLSGVYPGSVVRACAACGARVWVGPRSLTAVQAGAVIGCYLCIAVANARAGGLPGRVQPLGNADRPVVPRGFGAGSGRS